MLQKSQLREFIKLLAHASSKVITTHFANPDLVVDRKEDLSPVTAADRGAETVMRELIASHYPEHGIIGEEFGNSREDAEYVWVLDPVDGTISFAAGVPLFGTLIGLLYRGRPVLGCIHQPTIGQLCIGDNEQTTLNGRRVRVRTSAGLAKATLLTTDLDNIAAYQNYDTFEALRHEVGMFRTWGDCFGYLQVATGNADIMIDPVLNPWDLLPLIPVIQGAGGVITAWDGSDAIAGKSCIAATPELHAEVVRRLNK